MVEEHDRGFEGVLGAVFDLERHPDFGFDDPAEVRDRLQGGAQPDLVVDQNRLVETQFLDAVVDHHLHVVHLYDLRPKVGKDRERQVSVRDGGAVGALSPRPLRVHMDPLVIEGRIREKVVRNAQLLSFELCEFFEIVDNQSAHVE